MLFLSFVRVFSGTGSDTTVTRYLTKLGSKWWLQCLFDLLSVYLTTSLCGYSSSQQVIVKCHSLSVDEYVFVVSSVVLSFCYPAFFVHLVGQYVYQPRTRTLAAIILCR